jgi:hypothetical protein
MHSLSPNCKFQITNFQVLLTSLKRHSGYCRVLPPHRIFEGKVMNMSLASTVQYLQATYEACWRWNALIIKLEKMKNLRVLECPGTCSSWRGYWTTWRTAGRWGCAAETSQSRDFLYRAIEYIDHVKNIYCKKSNEQMTANPWILL